ncbi:MAG: ParB/RepB/Spo0J family partition protein [Bdellovibrionaceae bacterium]|nr:ParB/RepB/Spo0J family partition protein [Pseudobdellovibrionaceae bacterium]MDW8189356.1 ParB/RepB/Spo0J family partition protein [Pseudobdellovibrionaceae bacterium]
MKGDNSTQPSKNKRVLGRGISSLLGVTNTLDNQLTTHLDIQQGIDAQRIWKIPIEKIKPSPWQPRQTFKQEELNELAASIKEKGVIQPIVVRQEGDFFELIAGERRWRAAQMAGLHELPAIIKNYDDIESLEVAIIENIQRSNLDPIEEGLAYQKLMGQFGLTQAQIAQKVGKDRATIANLLRLLTLPPSVQEHLRKGLLSTGHAKVLLGLSDSKEIEHFASLIISKGLSVRQLERLIKSVRTDEGPKTRSGLVGSLEGARINLSDSIKSDSVNTKRIQNRLSQVLGTKVELKQYSDHGQLIIYYFSSDQLSEIVEKLGG